jgi:preprotein translocase subunit YajC
MVDLISGVDYLRNMGVVDVILPFVLVFTILYAVLQKVELFGGEGKSKKYNLVIALAIAASMVIMHTNGYYRAVLGYDPIDIITGILPGSALILLIVMTVLIVFAVIMPKEAISIPGSPIVSAVAVLGVIALAGIIIHNVFPDFLGYSWPSWLDDSGLQSVIIMIVVFGLVVWFVTSEPKKPEEKSGIKGFHNFMKDLTGTNK